ncbi:hypothetical protein KORDIASMS9_03925 [Kordia sp. SMS9]|uniref:hypothetical protein n=1 Tax=Kordia sp. SMS9 TaxID=2282170 RepID=UPI000E0DA909|nr:hypothetical protein [Kordia sp. SMS9]AXG71668.1 hypothetical protein KORDIASMS9_03925 [Kordia sp. SMS9]
MKKKILLLILMISFHYVYSQSFQRMAIAKGVYKLAPRASSKVTSYCLDFSRKAPTRGMDYGNILSGGTEAIVEVVSSSNNITRMPLYEAIKKDIIEIKGMNYFDGRGKEALTEIVSHGKRQGYDVKEYEFTLNMWDFMTIFEKNQVERNLAIMSGYSDAGSSSSLKFVNKIDDEVRIKLRDNIQLSSHKNETAIKGIKDINISSNPKKQIEDQGRVWASNERNNLLKLKKVGVYDGTTNVNFNNDGLTIDTKKIYSIIKNKYGIPSDTNSKDVFDNNLEKWINQRQKYIESSLKEIGLDGNFDELVKSYQKFKGEKMTGNFSNSLEVRMKRDLNKGIFISKKGKVYTTKKLKISNKTERVFVLEDNIYVKFSNKTHIDNLDKILSNRKYLKEEIEVISFAYDGTTRDALKELFPNNHLDFSITSMQKFRKKLKASKKKSIFVMGHIEHDAFVVKNQSLDDFKIPLDDLRMLAKELDVNIFPLGCNSGSSGTGLGNTFNSIDALHRLKPAFENNKTIKGLLRDLSGDDLRIVIDDIPFENKGYLKAQICKEIKLVGTSGLLSGGTLGLIIYKTLVESDDDDDDDDEK